MASDTSDTEEFYDAPEDVNFTPSPKVSSAKFVLPSAQSAGDNESCGAATSESQQDDPLQIIDSIIEESQKGSAGEGAELLDQLHVDVKAEVDNDIHQEDDDAQDVPVGSAVPAVQPQFPEQEQQESIATNGACALPAHDPTESPGPSGPSQEAVQPPDITSTVGQKQPEGEQDQSPADILDQVSLTDRQVDLDTSGPLKPPRQFTVGTRHCSQHQKAPSFTATPS
ncbi:hypothetical protein fugu_009130 [Takifugu bimaculatus]|uniref:Uncharacterized protein n=1 Tax=Takifugu bimaculatus TaxID=433685 RepID=A0A4Z2AXR7_9TELE|nr:hypothetical protein fugu_009130 [Takifugu bimaculatus]